jgi:predicted N-acetyltransferase YhbS
MGAYGQGSGRVARIRVMEICPAGWGDLEAAAELLGVQNRAAVGVPGVRREHPRSEWEASGFALGKDNFVAEEAGRVVGYAAVSTSGELTLAASGEQLGDELLGRVASRARVRGERTLGSALVALGLAEFARRGKRRVGLKVDAGNPTGAVQLYERLGFFIERREAVWAWSL